MVTIYPLVKKNLYEINLSHQEKEKFTILIVGGSQGAKIFDKNLKDIIVKISRIKPIKIIQQTSEKKYFKFRKFL